MQSTLLYLVRHGATEANLRQPPLLLGNKLNPPLAVLGLRQAESVRAALAGFPLRHVYTSPLLRAAQTAAVVAEPHGLRPQPLAELTECDLGRWEGLTWDEVGRRDSELYAQFKADPWGCPSAGGESFRAVHARASRALEAVASRHVGEAVLVVAHHGVLRTCLAFWLGLPPHRVRQVTLDNGSISVVAFQGAAVVRSVNEIGHLGTSEATAA